MKLLNGDVSQSADSGQVPAQQSHRLLALRPARIVSGIHQLAGLSRIGYKYREPGVRQRNRLVIQRPRIDEESMIGAAQGGQLTQCDVTIIGERPKVGPHREAMIARLAEIMGVDPHRISVQATTTEKLGFTGRGEGIAAQAVVLLERA